MDRYSTCLPIILRFEGGRVDDPDDHGGRTNQGITQTVYDAWRDAGGHPRADVWDIQPAEVSAIYRVHYWAKVCADHLGAPLDLVVFDAAVNSGPTRAARWLQQVVGATVDGDIGPATLAAVHALDARTVALGCLDAREAFLRDLATRPGQAKFLKGWLSRCETLRGMCG